MDELSPVLAYLKSWGQYDAYDRVVAARDRIDFQAEVIDSQGRRIEELHGQRNAARRSMGLAKEAYTADLDAALATIERLREALDPLHSTLSFLRSVIASGEPMTPEVRRAIDNAQERLRLADTEERTDG